MNTFYVLACVTFAAAVAAAAGETRDKRGLVGEALVTGETRDKRGLVGEALVAPALHTPLLGYEAGLLGAHGLHAPLLNPHLAHSLHNPLLASSLYSSLYGHGYGASLYSPLYGHGSSLYSPLGYGYGYPAGLHSPLLASPYLGAHNPLLSSLSSPLLGHGGPALTIVKSSGGHSGSNGHGKQNSEH